MRSAHSSSMMMSPSPSTVMTPRNEASTNIMAVLPSKTALSDSKPRLQRATSETKHHPPHSLSEIARKDKENQSSLSLPEASDLWPFCADFGNVSSNRSSVQPLDSSSRHDSVHSDVIPTSEIPRTESPRPLLPFGSNSSSTTPTPTAESNCQSTSAMGQTTFWLNFLEDHNTEPSNNDDVDGEGAPTCFTPLGQLIQRTSTSGSPLSDASAYDTQEIDDTNLHSQSSPDHNPTVTLSMMQPSEEKGEEGDDEASRKEEKGEEKEEDEAAPKEEKGGEKEDEAAPSEIKASTNKEPAPIDMLSPVQAARLLFEQRAQQAATAPSWNKHPQSGQGKGNRTFQTPTKNNNYSKQQIKIVREAMTSPNVSRIDCESLPPTTTTRIPNTPDSIIEIGGSLSISAESKVPSFDMNLPFDPVQQDLKSSTGNDLNPDATSTTTTSNNSNDVRTEETSTSTPEEELTPFQKARRNFSKHDVDGAHKTPPSFRSTPTKMVKQPMGSVPAVSNSSVKANRKPPLSPSMEKNQDSDQDFHKVLKAWRDKLDVRVNSQNHSGESTHAWTRTRPNRKGGNHANVPTDSELSTGSHSAMIHGSYSNDGSSHFFESDTMEESYDESEEPSRALVILEHHNSVQIMIGDSNANDTSHDELKIRNVELVPFMEQTQIIDQQPCECSGSVFSGNDDLVSFFLPQMGMACTCGRISTGFVNPYEPTALENVLRPWQVEFLNSFGIHRGEQFVKARHRSGAILARALRQWRKKHNMLYFKTSSCAMAIDIWAKTCKIFVRSIRRQIKAGQDFLENSPHQVMNELVSFVDNLPDAPQKVTVHDDFILENIELESQVEV